jgi:phosphate:Na+ symporter
MEIIGVLFRMGGGLCMFIFGMKVMSEGIQQSAGDKLRKTLNFMTGNRFAGVLTGLVVTGIIQSSHAVTLMAVSFVNAGLLSLTQSIGVIMGANIGTTVTAWIVSLIGFSFQISNFALPAIGIGFVLGAIKWKHKSLGGLIMGLGFLFLGLHYLTQEMGAINNYIDFSVLSAFNDMGFAGTLIGAAAGMVMTFFVHSSSASTAIVLTMAYNNIVTYEMAASMVLGANIGTTFDAMLVTIGAKTAAKRAAMVHLLFNLIGACWALPLLKPLLALVSIILPGDPVGFGVTTHIAMLHTVFNTINTILFLPFVNQYAKLVTFIIKEDKPKEESGQYRFPYISGAIADTPEINILHAEKEIRDMAGIASSMYARFSAVLDSMQETPLTEEAVAALTGELKDKENYADEMREALTTFLVECARERLSSRTEKRVSRLLRIIADLEDMTDDCYSISLLLERGVRKDHVIKNKELTALIPYVALVEEFLNFIKNIKLGSVISKKQAAWARDLENQIDESRDRLRKLGRKRIEAGKDVKTELLFIDLVRRIEKLGDYCYSSSEALTY